jgi:putative salt-induced outer membrane protein YdiY
MTGAVMAGDATEAGEWDASLAVGVNLTQGNTETLGINSTLTTARSGEEMEYRFGLEANYGESTLTATNGLDETEITTQNAKAYANIKRKLGAPYVYSDSSLFHDDLAELDYRAMIGLGGGAYALDNETEKLGLEMGLSYIMEAFASGESDAYMALRVAARHDHTFSATAKCWAAIEYLPSLDDFAMYLLNGEIGTTATLNGTLSLRLVAQDRYQSEPPAGLDGNDLAILAALALKL